MHMYFEVSTIENIIIILNIVSNHCIQTSYYFECIINKKVIDITMGTMILKTDP